LIKAVVFDMDGVLRLAIRLEVAPDEMLYFDDDATYVVGAREAGLSADRVGGAPDVRASLAVHGLGVGSIAVDR
jgi:beta-phosphoglucomutase-like phosphatase (HAD superfamily)